MYKIITVIFTFRTDNCYQIYKKSVYQCYQSFSNESQQYADWLEANELIKNTKPGNTECMAIATPHKTKNIELKDYISKTNGMKRDACQITLPLHRTC